MTNLYYISIMLCATLLIWSFERERPGKGQEYFLPILFFSLLPVLNTILTLVVLSSIISEKYVKALEKQQGSR